MYGFNQTRKVRSFAEIAKLGNKTSQYFTDLKKEKANYSREILDMVCSRFGINAAWIVTGEGEMLKGNTPALSSELKEKQNIFLIQFFFS